MLAAGTVVVRKCAAGIVGPNGATERLIELIGGAYWDAEMTSSFDAEQEHPRWECIGDAESGIGEAPVWSETERALYWIDVPAGVSIQAGRQGLLTPDLTRSAGGVGAAGLLAGGGPLR